MHWLTLPPLTLGFAATHDARNPECAFGWEDDAGNPLPCDCEWPAVCVAEITDPHPDLGTYTLTAGRFKGAHFIALAHAKYAAESAQRPEGEGRP